MTLRSRLIAAFLASTLLPLVATVWITTSLLDRSSACDNGRARSTLAHARDDTKQFYQRERDALKQDALAGRTRPTTYVMSNVGRPESIRSFWESGEPEGFGVSGASGERRTTCGVTIRRPAGVEIYSRDLGGVSMEQLSTQVRETRRLVDAIDARDLRRDSR